MSLLPDSHGMRLIGARREIVTLGSRLQWWRLESATESRSGGGGGGRQELIALGLLERRLLSKEEMLFPKELSLGGGLNRPQL